MRKLTISPVMIAIVVAGLLFGSIHFGVGQTITSVKGVIDSDTTWTKTNSPYTLDGNVLVSNRVTLTIEAGTTINLKAHYIMVNGTLVSKGTSANQIIFQGGSSHSSEIIFTESSTVRNEQIESGNIINNAYINGTSIIISGGSPKISTNFIEYGAIIIESGAPVISNNKFYSSQVKVNDGTPVISGNDMPGGETVGFEVQYFTPIIISGGTAVISNNNIHNGDIGIEVKQGNPYIEDNNITGCQPDLIINEGVVERNYFEGIIEIGNVILKNNTVTSIEVQGSSLPTILYNNVVSLRLSSSNNVNVAYNWWGTTNTAEIQRSIWDYTDDFNLGKVNYTPFLTAANPQAMPDPNVPIPTPKPSTSPTATPDPDSSISPSQNPTATPNQSSSGTTVLLGLDWAEIAIIALLSFIAVLLVFVVVFLRKRNVK
jgi:hypothetical protein